MAFQHVRSLIAGSVEIAAPKDVVEFTLAAGVTGVIGRVYYFDDGELKLAVTGQMKTAVVCLSTAAAAGKVRGGWITPGQVYRCPITQKDGTAAATTDVHASVKVGQGVTINDTGDGIDGATEIANDNDKPLTILHVDKTNLVAHVIFSSCLVSYDTKQGAT